MMNEQKYLSVRQVANAANVSAQAIYQRVDKDLKPFVKLIKGRKMLSVEVLQLFGVSDLTSTCQEEPKELDKQLTSNEITDIQPLQQEVQELKRQLLDKQSQIKQLELDKHELELDKQLTSEALKHQISSLESIVETMTKQNDILNSRLDKAEAERERLEQTISNLTVALSAAQALHGIDKQQAVIEVKDPTEQESHPEQGAEQEPEQKRSFFSKIFKRK